MRDETDTRQRRAAVNFVVIVGIIGTVLAAVANAWIAIQLHVWQLGLTAFLQLLASLGLIGVRSLARRSRYDAAGWLACLCSYLAFGGGELTQQGFTIPLLVSGILITLLLGIIINPRRWYFWVSAAILYGGLIWLINIFTPLPRYDISGVVTFQWLIILIVAILLILGAFQFFRVLRFGTIRARLITSFIVLVLLPAILIAAVTSTLSAQRAIQQILYQLSSVADLKQNEINAWIDSLYSNMRLAIPSSDQISFTEMLLQKPKETDIQFYQVTYDREKRRLEQVMVQSGVFTEIFLVAPNGMVMLSTDDNHVGKNEYGYPYFEAGLDSMKVLPTFRYPYSGQMTVIVATPIVNADGVTVGTLAAQANLASLGVIMLERAGLGNTGEAYLVDSSSLFLMTDVRTEGYITGESVVNSNGISLAALEKGNGTAQYDNYSGAAVYGAYRYLLNLNMALLVEQKQNEALLPILQSVLINLGFTIAAGLIATVIALIVTNRITTPIASLAKTAEQIAAGNLGLVATIDQQDEIGALATSFNAMTAQLRQILAGLENQVRERTAALEQRSSILQASAEISRAVSSVLDPQELTEQVVELIRDRFHLYYVGLFQVDETGEWAVLKAGTGEAGRAMLSRDHRIKVGSGMIGWCISFQKPRIAQRADLDASRLVNPDLPDTRSEAAIPLRSRGRVIGALTIQSEQSEAFDEASITIFETMADQVATAIDNARLFTESQNTLISLRKAYGEITHKGWMSLLKDNPDLGYRSDAAGGVMPVEEWQPEMELALNEGRTLYGVVENGKKSSSVRGSGTRDESEYYLSVPIKVRDSVIGVFTAYKPVERGEWTNEEIAFLEEITENLGIVLDSARFYSDAQVKAETERMITEITARIRQTLDIDTVMQTATRELRHSLDLAEVEIRMDTEKDSAR